ncbi:MAG: hypothetical protein M0Z95_21690 [Actinomycetota bacterium]|jgi:hypothetical protein|nr:hypothetical protein [Actinomycetota bacterium]
MPAESGREWWDYLDAASRKVKIARYHAEKLDALLQSGAAATTVAVQAHFEGVLYALVAAWDKTEEGINLQFSLGLAQDDLHDALKEMPKSRLRSSLFKLYQSAIAADVRSIRRLAVHHSYKKTPRGPQLEVELPTGKAYGGSRTLIVYANAAVSHLESLEPLLDQLCQVAPSVK